jgi:hypothetical protein
MLSLVIVTCLATSPTQCSMVKTEPVEVQGFRACKLLMQPHVTGWQTSHPDEIVKNAFCEESRPSS